MVLLVVFFKLFFLSSKDLFSEIFMDSLYKESCIFHIMEYLYLDEYSKRYCTLWKVVTNPATN